MVPRSLSCAVLTAVQHTAEFAPMQCVYGSKYVYMYKCSTLRSPRRMTDYLDSCNNTEVCTVLCVLKSYDRTQSIFQRYSVRRKNDRELISIILHENAIVNYDLIMAISGLFPYRVLGPFLLEKNFEIEILDKPILDESRDDNKPPPTVQKGNLKKRKVDETVESIKRIVVETACDKNNTTPVRILDTRDGQDTYGVWIEFDLDPGVRIDLSFANFCMVSDIFDPVKRMAFNIRTCPVLQLRLYKNDERRLITQWELVVGMPRSGSFIKTRRRIEFSDHTVCFDSGKAENVISGNI